MTTPLFWTCEKECPSSLLSSERECQKRSFKFSAAMLWSQLSNEAKFAESDSSLKKLIRLLLGLLLSCVP